jgi:hypothetical protein
MPRYRSYARHLRTVGSTLVLVATLVILPGLFAPASGATTSPVPLHLHVVWRASVNGWPVDVDLPLRGSASASIAADGNLTIPRDAVLFSTDPQNPEPVSGTSITTVELRAERDLRGAIDRATGSLWLQGDLVFLLSGNGLTNCPIGPTTITFTSNNPDGRAYDAAAGSATVATDPEFMLPPIADGSAGCADQEPWFNIGLGLGFPGTSALRVDLGFPGGTAPPPPPSGPVSTAPPAPAPTPAPPVAVPPAAPSVVASPARATAPTPTSAKKAAKKPATTTTRASNARAAAGATTSTSYTGPAAADPNEILPVPPLRAEPGGPPTTDRTPIAARTPLDDGHDRTSLGIGVLLGSVAGGIAGIFLLRAEAQKLLRRKRHAAF